MIGRCERVYAGGEEGFVGIDIAEAGDQALVEEGGLDGSAGGSEESGEAGGGEVERFGAEVLRGGLDGRQKPDGSEAAGVAKAELGGV